MKTNRIIALLLSVIFIFSVNVTGFAAEEEVLFEPAVYNEIITLLDTLGLIDVNYYAEETPDIVKRGEFAQAAAKIIGIAPSGSFVPSFADVPSEHEYAPYIYAMKNAGYMSGMSEDTFAPDEPVYFEQAISVLVKLAGYNDVALATGGYPTGYMSIASRNGILDNVYPLVGSPLTKGTLLELIKSTATCDMLIPTAFGDSTSYTSQEGVNILSYYHKIYEGNGIVNADAITTMDSARAEVGNVIIEGITYKKANDTILNNSVGRKVDFYYKSQSNTKTIIFAALNSDVREASFTAGPDLDFNYATGTYTYDVPGTTLKYKIGYDYRVIYNMNELYPVLEDKMLPEAGTLTLIDNNDDGTYEIVIVDEFINIVAQDYGANADKIVDVLDPSRVIRFEDYESYQVIDAVGAPYAKTDIQKYDIIEFYESTDGMSCTAIVKRTGLPVVIDSIDENYVYAGTSKYLVSADVRESISSLFLGSQYTIYLNSKGELVYWLRGDDLKFGYVYNVQGKGVFDYEARAQIYTTSGQVTTLPIAAKVTNYTTVGTTISSANLKNSDYATIFPETNYRELVGYKLNAAGEICVVYHPMILTDREDAKNPPAYPLYRLDHFYGNVASTGVIGNSLGNQIVMNTGAPIMIVPPVATTEVNPDCLKMYDGVRAAFWDVYSAPTMTGYNGEVGEALFYMMGNAYPFVNAMIYHAEVSGNAATPGLTDFLVTKIRNVYDEKTYENKIVLEGRLNNAKKTTTIEVLNPNLLKRESFMTIKYGSNSINAAQISPTKTEIEVGDVISAISDTTGKVIGLALLYDSVNHVNLLRAGNRYGYPGTITYVGNNAVEYLSTTNVETTLDVSSMSIWVFEADKTKNRLGSIDDIEVGDRVYHNRFSSGNIGLAIYKD